MTEKIEITFPDYLVKALTKAHESLGIDIECYIIQTVEDDLRLSETGNDTVLNKIIQDNVAEIMELVRSQGPTEKES